LYNVIYSQKTFINKTTIESIPSY